MSQFSDHDMRRIAATVSEYETRTKTTRLLQANKSAIHDDIPMVAIAAEDIEHDSLGDCYRATGSGFDQTLTEDTGTTFEVYNPGLMVWDGARVLIQHCRLPEGERKWNIVHAWSATRIRCTAPSSGGISAGGSGTCTSVTTLNGHYSPTTATVFSWTDDIAIQASKKLLAGLVWTGTVSRWEVYSADCV